MSKDRDKKLARVREAKLEAALAKALDGEARSERFADRLIDDVNRLSQEVDALQKRIDVYEPPTVVADGAATT